MNNNKEFTNLESPFTELFSLLKRYENPSTGLTTLAYSSDEFKIMHQHINNAIDVLLQGLQSVGHLMSIAPPHEGILEELNNLGFFISTVTNLTEALNYLKSDADYVLKQRGIENY